jgi:hypothetical protein
MRLLYWPLLCSSAHPHSNDRRFKMKMIKNQKGQGVMEYVILTSLIGIFSLMAVKQFGTVIENRIENMKEYVVKQVPLKNL